MKTKFKQIGRLKRISRRNKLSLLVIFALSIICCFSIYASNINADTILYEDDNGIKYYEEDILVGDKNNEALKWNISDTGTGDLWAYIFKEKDENGYVTLPNNFDRNALILVITGSYRNVLNFNKLYYLDNAEMPYYFTKTGSVNDAFGVTYSNWRSDAVVPWSYIDVYETAGRNRIRKAIIDNGCNPNNYSLFFGSLHGLEEVIFESNTSETKTPSDFTGMFYDSWIKEFKVSECVDTSGVTSVDYMFYCANTEIIDLSNFDFTNAGNANHFAQYSGVKLIMLPSEVDSYIEVNGSMHYYNKTNKTYTRLKQGSSGSCSCLVGRRSDNVTLYDTGEPSNLEVNCLVADGYIKTPLFIDDNGVEYYDTDIYCLDLGSPINYSIWADWNISESGSGNLHAYIFEQKDEDGNKIKHPDYPTRNALMLVITGTETDALDFEKTSFVGSDLSRFYITKNSEVYDITYNLSVIMDWRSDKVVPWSYLDQNDGWSPFSVINRAVVDKGCNPDNYNFFFTKLHDVKEVEFRTNQGEKKTPTSMIGTFIGNWWHTFVWPEAIDARQITSIDKMFLYYEGLEYLDLSKCNFERLTSGSNFLKTNENVWGGPDYIKQIVLPSYLKSGTVIDVDTTLYYFNQDGSKFKRLMYILNETGNKIIGEAAPPDVQDEYGERTMYCINCMKTLDYEYFDIYKDSDGNVYSVDDLAKWNGVDTSMNARWNISDNGTGNLWANVFVSKDNPDEYILVFTGEYKNSLEFEYAAYSSNTYSTYVVNYENVIANASTNLTGFDRKTWRNQKLTPWSLMQDKYKITKAVVSAECAPSCYNYFTTELSNLKEFIVEPYKNSTAKKKVSGMECMFYGTTIKEFEFPDTLDYSEFWDMYAMFAWCRNLESVDFTNLDIPDVLIDAGLMFFNCSKLNCLDGINKEYMFAGLNATFYGCSKLTSVNLENWDVSRVEDFNNLFSQCAILEEIKISSWDLSCAKVLRSLLNGCLKLTDIDISGWDVSGVEDFSYLFYNCDALEDLGISKWNMSSAKTLEAMLCGLTQIEYLDLRNWNVSNVENMLCVFGYNHNLKAINMSGWKSTKLNNTNSLFYDLPALEYVDMENFETSNLVTNKGWEFSLCTLSAIILPKKLEGVTFNLPSSLNYYNLAPDGTLTPLKLNGEASGTVLVPKTSGANVTTLDGEETDLEINVMKTENGKLYFPRTNDLSSEEKTLNKDDDLIFKLKFNENISLKDIAIAVENLPKLILKFTGDASDKIGTGNILTATFKEITDDVVSFVYKVKEDDLISKESNFEINELQNSSQLVGLDGLESVITKLTKTFNKLYLNYTEPQPQPSSHKKKKTEEKPIEPEMPALEEPKKKALMQGYEDSTFKPSSSVSREEVATIVARAYEGFDEEEDFKTFNTFKDAEDRWSENYVGFCSLSDLIHGYEDGSYQPTNMMTRAELCVLVSNFKEFRDLDTGTLNSNSSFPDVKGRWFEPYVNKLVALGIIEGYDDGEFKGERYVTRVEMAIVMNRVDKRHIDNIPDEYLEKVVAMFKDVKKDDWFFKDVALATLDLPNELFSNEESENE